MSIATAQSAPSLRHLVDKLVVLVGGTSGIGYSVAQASLEHGARVIISSSTQAKVDAAVKRLLAVNPLFEGKVSGSTLNAKDVKSVEAFWDKVGKFDHLVWTAGDSLLTNFMDEDLETQKATFDVRFWGPVLSAKYAYKKGLFNPGASVTMSVGTVVRKPAKGWAMIAAVTGAVESITRGLAVELAPIRVNTVAPGGVDTELWGHMPADVKAGFMKGFADHSLVQHTATPDEIAESYLFLMKCTNMTGKTIDVEGGALLC
ncbi:short-chain dehydrogenase/reductase SDR [Dacryopinax primogenitus]|uniref:Short-chain dehydrogenase/reductase SDR n=1 Tax=Dacryopinax primogenitus (strain DJM 731) TaxID=1858805 RepID=M5G6B9_DACPD|nr:short-chain dehydrogenase/reductase SDR [Dacryopinax primogenitus]EJU04234.1 short-chain dehydrogenase/reductase SDR [Dacryopinax primogenitus]